MDRRETILARLLVILDSIQTGLTAERNAPTIDPDARPALILFDGDEVAEPSDPNRGGPPSMRRVTMSPDIVILASAPNENIGAAINALRMKVLQAVLTDATLLGYTINGRDVVYAGAQQIVEDGRRVEGAMALSFEITYRLHTSELT